MLVSRITKDMFAESYMHVKNVSTCTTLFGEKKHNSRNVL